MRILVLILYLGMSTIFQQIAYAKSVTVEHDIFKCIHRVSNYQACPFVHHMSILVSCEPNCKPSSELLKHYADAVTFEFSKQATIKVNYMTLQLAHPTTRQCSVSAENSRILASKCE